MSTDFTQAVGEIQAEYERRDASASIDSQFRAFEPLELGYRRQQLCCLASFLRQRGFSDLSGMRILDFGCGSGRFLGDLLGLGGDPARLCGVDVMPRRLASARRKYPQIDFQQSDGVTLPFAEASFDLVTQSVVFSSVGSGSLRLALASDIQRVLKPGGYFYW